MGPSFEVVLKENDTYRSREQCTGPTGKGNTDAWIAQNTLSKRALRLTIDVIYNIRIKIMSLILKQ